MSPPNSGRSADKMSRKTNQAAGSIQAEYGRTGLVPPTKKYPLRGPGMIESIRSSNEISDEGCAWRGAATYSPLECGTWWAAPTVAKNRAFRDRAAEIWTRLRCVGRFGCCEPPYLRTWRDGWLTKLGMRNRTVTRA